jgi:prepilin-type N-terminal cleavage/methylation domain-containing protein
MAAASPSRTGDEGMSLLEVVIAMLLFAVLALAILPLAMQASVASAGNRDRVSANTFASSQLAAARAAYPDEGANLCTSVRGLVQSGIADPAGTGLVADVTVAGCPSAYPAAIRLTVIVRDGQTDDEVVRMATKLVVTAR